MSNHELEQLAAMAQGLTCAISGKTEFISYRFVGGPGGGGRVLGSSCSFLVMYWIA
jgi:hypothetical protein